MKKTNDELSRRKFIKDGAVTATGLAAGIGAAGCQSMQSSKAAKETRSYNPEMEYRRLGKTDLMVSAVCLGGHWKRVDKMVPNILKTKAWLSADLDDKNFRKNRHDVISRCIERGINYVDACTREEVMAYSQALRGRRESMFFGYSWYQEEMRKQDFRTSKAVLGTLDKGMKEARLDYVDLWRIVMLETSSEHTVAEIDEMMNALEKAKKQGKVRFTGLSSHDRPHIKWMIENYPETVQVVVLPYTAMSKELPEDSVFDAIRKNDVGFFGIKPFASNSLFKGDSAPGNPHAEEDDRMARLAIRYILNNPAISAPIPGMINPQQVDNVARAVKEHRQLDQAEAKDLSEAMNRAWAALPNDYQWLKNWEYA
jgi:predicted aldo/keto reductase-like oxidoreductase